MPSGATTIGELTLFNVDTQETVRRVSAYITQNGIERLLSDVPLSEMVGYCQVGSGLVKHSGSSEALFHPRGTPRATAITVEDAVEEDQPIWVIRARALFPQGSITSKISEIAYVDENEQAFIVASIISGNQIKAVPVNAEDRLECRLTLKIPKPEVPKRVFDAGYALNSTAISVTAKLQSGAISTTTGDWRFHLGVDGGHFVLLNGSVLQTEKSQVSIAHDRVERESTLSFTLDLSVDISEEVTWAELAVDDQGARPVMTLEWSRPWTLSAAQPKQLQFTLTVPWDSTDIEIVTNLYPFNATESTYTALGYTSANVTEDEQTYTWEMGPDANIIQAPDQVYALPESFDSEPAMVDFSSDNVCIELQINQMPTAPASTSGYIAGFSFSGVLLTAEDWMDPVFGVGYVRTVADDDVTTEHIASVFMRGGPYFNYDDATVRTLGVIYRPGDKTAELYLFDGQNQQIHYELISTPEDLPAEVPMLGVIIDGRCAESEGQTLSARMETRTGYYRGTYPAGTTDIAGNLL